MRKKQMKTLKRNWRRIFRNSSPWNEGGGKKKP